MAANHNERRGVTAGMRTTIENLSVRQIMSAALVTVDPT
jgi:hypothetical protein